MNSQLPPLKRIAAVHDLSGLGKCSLTVALPIISATGVECACIPTALLSTHTGEFTGFTIRDLSDEILPIATHWQSTGAMFDGIYSGYLASPAQEQLLEGVIDRLASPETLVIVDPVMADNGVYYHNLGDEMCAAFRRLCARADIITPNITEAALLAGIPYQEAPHEIAYIQRLLSALAELGPRTVAITGVQLSAGEVGAMALDRQSGQTYTVLRPVRPGVFYGTGDIFASALAALLVRGAGMEQALDTATALVADSIQRSCCRDTPRRFGVDFEGALPDYIRRVENIFGSIFPS
jgi:pyridoxine kinase